jgi:hypothetical protein
MSKVYIKKPRDIYELKNAIKGEIMAIPGNMLTEAMRTARDRLEHRRRDDGKYLRDVI